MGTNRLKYLVLGVLTSEILLGLAAAAGGLLMHPHAVWVYRMALCAAIPHWAFIHLPSVLLTRVAKWFPLPVSSFLPLPLSAADVHAQIVANAVMSLFGGILAGFAASAVRKTEASARRYTMVILLALIAAYAFACVQIPRLDPYPKSPTWRGAADTLLEFSNAVIGGVGGRSLSSLPPEMDNVAAWTRTLIVHSTVMFAMVFVAALICRGAWLTLRWLWARHLRATT